MKGSKKICLFQSFKTSLLLFLLLLSWVFVAFVVFAVAVIVDIGYCCCYCCCCLPVPVSSPPAPHPLLHHWTLAYDRIQADRHGNLKKGGANVRLAIVSFSKGTWLKWKCWLSVHEWVLFNCYRLQEKDGLPMDYWHLPIMLPRMAKKRR